MPDSGADLGGDRSCRICGSGNPRAIFDGTSQCGSCDAIFKDDPSDPKDYFLAESGTKQKAGYFQRKFWDLMAGEYIKYLKMKTDMDFRNVLDVGTYFGHFMRSLGREIDGCRITGIEPSEARVAAAVSGNIIRGYFDAGFESDGGFDLICFNEVLYYS
ncbi:MAG: class I SAM-dependent methyltransferase [Alphaproteobacteria bacterium]|nr:class I SAM-dependent methyltransferase [Alphaproteobacteria bacterium]